MARGRGDDGKLKPAVDFFGSQRAMAEKLGMSPSGVTHWIKRGIPIIWAIEIEKVTEGKVTKDVLLPEIFKPENGEITPQQLRPN
jgi:DNA-binding transcriptional regulator YdaS (Cro superfamily)